MYFVERLLCPTFGVSFIRNSTVYSIFLSPFPIHSQDTLSYKEAFMRVIESEDDGEGGSGKKGGGDKTVEKKIEAMKVSCWGVYVNTVLFDEHNNTNN